MAVYVDDAFIPFKSKTGRVYKMSHMLADTDDELFEMAKKTRIKNGLVSAYELSSF